MRNSDLLPPISKSRPRQTVAASVRLLWMRSRIVAAFVITSAVVAVVVSLLLPPRYESTTRLLPAPRSAGNLSSLLRPEASALAGLAGIDANPSEGRFLALLHSRALADRIIDRFGLMKTYGARYRHEARTALAEHTTILEDRKTGVITISVSDRDPQRAAAIAGAYPNELDMLNSELNTSGAHMERVFLESRVNELGSELHDAADRLSQFSTKYSLLDAQEQPKSTVDAALKLQGELIAAQAELKGLQAIYTPYSQKVRAAQARVSELGRQLGEIKGAKAVPDAPQDGALPSIRSLPALGVTYEELFQRAKLLKAVQLALTQQLELAKTEEIKQLPAFRVMDPAEVPEQRAFPRRTSIVAVSTMAGFFLGIAFVLGFESWKGVSPEDPIKELVSDIRQGLQRATNYPRRNGHSSNHIDEDVALIEEPK